MKTIVCYSGGHDSIYLAYRLLKDTTDEITLFILTSDSVNWAIKPKQLERVYDSIELLKTIRNFEVICHDVSYANVSNTFIFDTDKTYAIKVLADDINNGKYDRIANGRSWEQTDGSYYLPDLSLKGFLTDINAKKLADKILTRGSIWLPLVDNTFHENYGRWHTLMYLPEVFIKTSISYLSPNDDYKRKDTYEAHDPNVVDKCVYDILVKQKINAGCTEEEYISWRCQKDIEYGGNTGKSCMPRHWSYFETEPHPYSRSFPHTITTKEQFIAWYSKRVYKDHHLDSWSKSEWEWIE